MNRELKAASDAATDVSLETRALANVFFRITEELKHLSLPQRRRVLEAIAILTPRDLETS